MHVFFRNYKQVFFFFSKPVVSSIISALDGIQIQIFPRRLLFVQSLFKYHRVVIAHTPLVYCPEGNKKVNRVCSLSPQAYGWGPSARVGPDASFMSHLSPTTVVLCLNPSRITVH